mmetsp:Transcript_94487/g.244482  ORF Transcript_94487/g.244482 Transcript_94487/m.244482 type:complete len:326 (-) Transcript_94487:302-1279(-)
MDGYQDPLAASWKKSVPVLAEHSTSPEDGPQRHDWFCCLEDLADLEVLFKEVAFAEHRVRCSCPPTARPWWQFEVICEHVCPMDCKLCRFFHRAEVCADGVRVDSLLNVVDDAHCPKSILGESLLCVDLKHDGEGRLRATATDATMIQKTWRAGLRVDLAEQRVVRHIVIPEHRTVSHHGDGSVPTAASSEIQTIPEERVEALVLLLPSPLLDAQYASDKRHLLGYFRLAITPALEERPFEIEPRRFSADDRLVIVTGQRNLPGEQPNCVRRGVVQTACIRWLDERRTEWGQARTPTTTKFCVALLDRLLDLGHRDFHEVVLLTI